MITWVKCGCLLEEISGARTIDRVHFITAKAKTMTITITITITVIRPTTIIIIIVIMVIMVIMIRPDLQGLLIVLIWRNICFFQRTKARVF
jgi:hypothetical protein